MSKPLNSYPWYPADWRGSETRMAMTAEERGIYRDLLDHCWVEGSLPNCEKTLRFIASCTLSEWRRSRTRVLQQFDQFEDRLTHKKVEERRPQLVDWHEQKREAGKKSGLARAKGKGTNVQRTFNERLNENAIPFEPSLSSSLSLPPISGSKCSEHSNPPPADQKTKIARRIQEMLTEMVGSMPDLDACKPAAEEVFRFELPIAKLRTRIQAILERERSVDPDWAPRSWGWARTVVAEEARIAGKIHTGELDPDPPSAPRPPKINTISTGGRIVGMSRPGRLKMIDFAVAA